MRFCSLQSTVIYKRGKQAGESPERRTKNGGDLGSMSFEKRLVDVLNHRITTKREVQDVVYYVNIPLQTKYQKVEVTIFLYGERKLLV